MVSEITMREFWIDEFEKMNSLFFAQHQKIYVNFNSEFKMDQKDVTIMNRIHEYITINLDFDNISTDLIIRMVDEMKILSISLEKIYINTRVKSTLHSNYKNGTFNCIPKAIKNVIAGNKDLMKIYNIYNNMNSISPKKVEILNKPNKTQKKVCFAV